MKIWKTIKRNRKILIRFTKDLWNKDYFRFSKKSTDSFHWKYRIELVQEIKKNETYNSKIHNFSKASKLITQHIIMPGELFSFWRSIGNPNKQFQKGRTIQNGKIIEEAGGGLCQVSGIMYHLSLISGLTILERFNHSVDIYTEESRFCPLGTDAAIVYGYKDLRIANPHSFPIQFKLGVHGNLLKIELCSIEPIEKKALHFTITEMEGSKKVTILDANEVQVSSSNYQVMDELVS